MGNYWSSKKEDDTDGGSKSKKRKLNGQELGILKSKEYQVVYGVSPVNVQHLPPHLRSMFVLRKAGSMYLDEDGDLAHEFYQEERLRRPSGSIRWSMKRIVNNLTPQGEVDLPFPRLRTNVPIVLLDSNATIVPR